MTDPPDAENIGPRPVDDPATLEAIAAELVAAVREAQLRARLQRLGRLPPPSVADPDAVELLRSVQSSVDEPGALGAHTVVEWTPTTLGGHEVRELRFLLGLDFKRRG